MKKKEVVVNQMNEITQEEMELQRESAKKTLEASYIMYERSKNDTMDVREHALDSNGKPKYSKLSNASVLKKIEMAQKDIVEQYKKLGYTEKELIDTVKKEMNKKKEGNKSILNKIINKITKQEEKDEKEKITLEAPKVNDSINDYLRNTNGLKMKENAVKNENNNKPVVNTIEEEDNRDGVEVKQNNKEMFDYVKLPSKGECYKEHFNTLKVSYLNAYDENMILSPSLYKEGDFLSYLVKNKVIDAIDTDNLVQGDAEAIVLWLRANAYGNEYPIVVTDQQTGSEFETVVDLTQIKYKKFNLKGDEDGYFDYTIPSSGDRIKFKFLTNRDLKFLNKVKQKESDKIKVMSLKRYIGEIKDAITNNDLVNSDLQEKVNGLISTINEDIINTYNEADDLTFTHELTDRLILQTISVNGIVDRGYINDYILNLNIKDASEYRKYILDNTPGIDYNVKVERPASLGGGLVDTFLQFDQFIFINF